MIHPPLLTQAELDSPDFVLLETASALAVWMDKLSQSHTALGIDTETNGDNPRQHDVCLIQLGVIGLPICLVDLRRMTRADLEPLAVLLQQPRLKLFQNGKFDLKLLTAMRLPVREPYFDTLLTSRLLRCGAADAHGLGDLVRFYLQLEMAKDAQTSFLTLGDDSLTPSQQLYAARDVKVLHPLWAVQETALGRRQADRAIAQLEHRLLPVLVGMELQGVGMDAAALKQLRQHWSAQVETARQTVCGLLCPETERPLSFFGGQPTINTLNLNSRKQVSEALESLGINANDTPKALLPLVGKHPAVSALLDYKYLDKQQVWLKKLRDSLESGRLYLEYNQCPRQHGRLGNSLKLEQWQQLEDIFTLFTPKPNQTLLWFDLRSLPLQLLAQASGDELLQHCLQDGLATGSLAYLIAVGCGVYGYRATTLQHWLWEQGQTVDVKTATRAAKAFFQTYAGIARYHQTIKDSDFYRATWLGRYRRLEAPDQKPAFSERLRHVCLTGASDLLKQMLITLPPHVTPLLACANGILIECSTNTWEQDQTLVAGSLQSVCRTAMPQTTPIPCLKRETQD